MKCYIGYSLRAQSSMIEQASLKRWIAGLIPVVPPNLINLSGEFCMM